MLFSAVETFHYNLEELIILYNADRRRIGFEVV